MKDHTFMDYFYSVSELPSHSLEKPPNIENSDEIQSEKTNEMTVNRISKFEILNQNSSPILIKDDQISISPLRIKQNNVFKNIEHIFLNIIVTNIVDEVVLLDGNEMDIKQKYCIPRKDFYSWKIGKSFQNEINENNGRFGW
jgi:hypothetical protein